MNTLPLTSTRFFAAMSVVIYHYGRAVYPFNLKGIHEVVINSEVAVSYFFLLSGFVMAIAYEKRAKENQLTTSKYLFNRVSRIYPVYFIALVLVCVQFHYLWEIEIKGKEVILNVALLQAWFQGKALSVNYPGWSLSVELFFYALFPLLFTKVIHLKTKWILLVSVTFWSLSQMIYLNGYLTQYNPLLHLNTFLLGVSTGVLVLRYQSISGKFRSYASYILLLGIVLLTAILLIPHIVSDYGHNGLLAPVFIMIVLGLIYSDGWLSRILSKRIFVQLGEISYSIYILQFPCLLFTRFYISKRPNWGIYYEETSDFFIYCLVLISASALSFYLIENPVKKLLQSFYSYLITFKKKVSGSRELRRKH